MTRDEPARYRQNPRPVGVEIAYRLEGDRLSIDYGRKIDTVRLGAVTRMRLTCEPHGLMRRAFRTALTLSNGHRIAFTSVSWSSMVQVRSLDADYRAFVLALAEAVGRASPDAAFLAGKPRLTWLITVAVTAAVLAGLALFVWRAFAAGAMEAALLGAAFAAAGTWQLLPLVRHNRPRRFAADAVPEDLLP